MSELRECPCGAPVDTNECPYPLTGGLYKIICMDEACTFSAVGRGPEETTRNWNRRPDPAPVGVTADFIGKYVTAVRELLYELHQETGTRYPDFEAATTKLETSFLNPQPGAVVGEAAMELATAIRSGVRKGDRCTYFTKRGMEAVEKAIENLLRSLTNTDKGVV